MTLIASEQLDHSNPARASLQNKSHLTIQPLEALSDSNLEARKRKFWRGVESPGSSGEGSDTKRFASMERLEAVDDDTSKIDTDLYSRQIGAFGLETMGRLIKMRVLISGLGGAGVETAKNLILAGPQKVTLHDDKAATLPDLASNFYLTEEDVAQGRSRAAACSGKLSELNDYVAVDVFEGEISSTVLSGYDVLVVSEMKLSDMVALNEICRFKNVGFIAMTDFGLACSVFVDFGPEFTVADMTGAPNQSAIIEGITKGNPGTVLLYQQKSFPFATGDWVRFREVRGMTELNDCEPIQIKRTGKHTFSICDTSMFSDYIREGVVEQVKMPVKLKFQTLKEALDFPISSGEADLLNTDYGKFTRPAQLHLAFRSVHEYRELYGTLPPVRSEAAVAQCLAIAEKLNQRLQVLGKAQGPRDFENAPGVVSVDSIDTAVLSNVARFSGCHISPMAAFLGGVVAQEVVKYTGKFTPLRQWLYFDALEALPSETPHGMIKSIVYSESDVTTTFEDRYAYHTAIWGKEFQNTLGKLKLFLVGAGALGCEFMKSFALMGACLKSQGGLLTVTDMDRIETSNLNRQFLFRRQHVGKSKSKTAAMTAMAMNADLAIFASETRVGPETEDEFNDEFWESLDGVVNALDNIQSRQYIDDRCVWYGKPLLESGTLGARANVQVILPRLTQSYSDSQDPPEDAIPLCTLRHFPNQVEHTIEWARDAFQGLFCDGPQQAKSFLQSPSTFLQRLSTEGTPATQREQLTRIHLLLTAVTTGSKFDSCVKRAVDVFASFFDHSIAQLIHTFPLDHINSEGQLFWNGPKRAPHAIRFDPRDTLHLDFVLAGASLFAFNIGLQPTTDKAEVFKIASSMHVEQFVPKQVAYKIDDGDLTVEGSGDDASICQALKTQLLNIDEEMRKSLVEKISPIEFEKDDDANHHVDFIYACANLRARNYRIPEGDRHKIKMIAGKIVPAIATTTAMITGLVSFELLKMINYKSRPLSDFKNSYICLGTQFYVMTEPAPPIQTKDKEYDVLVGGPIKAKPHGFTTWDFLEINLPDATLEQLINEIRETQDVEVSILSIGNICLYNSYLKSSHERLPRKIKELTETLAKGSLPRMRSVLAIEASCSDAEGIDVTIPTIKLRI